MLTISMLQCNFRLSLLFSSASCRLRLALPAAAYSSQAVASAADAADMPVEMDNPYKRPIRKCILCKEDFPLDYKNARLLSQFVSPYTGRMYGRHITGLCQPMQERVAHLVEQSRQFGYMAQEVKDTFYLSDPALFRNPLGTARRTPKSGPAGAAATEAADKADA